MGVSGSGKSTIGTLLGQRTGSPFLDADDLHPAANLAKMRQGIALTDDDRWPWLALVANWIAERTTASAPGIVGCSALKRAYRDLLRGPDPGLRLVYLRGDRQLLADRLSHRHGHFFPQQLLDAQLADLEEPTPDEQPIVVPIGQSADATVSTILAALGDPAHRSGAAPSD